MRRHAQALPHRVCASSASSQSDEPTVAFTELKILLLRVPPACLGQHEAAWRVPHIAAAQVLADCHDDVLPMFEGVGSYAWDAEIPPRSEWDRHAEEFAAHVAELVAIG